jgi:hypothetical protein
MQAHSLLRPRSVLAFLGISLGTGLGAALAYSPAAAADPDSSGLGVSSLFGLDPSALVGSAGADPSGLDLAVSYDGVSLFHSGDATATSFAGQGDLAIAYGDGASAYAGEDPLNGAPITSGDNYAFADGAGSTAISDSPSSSAIATDGGTAYSGFDGTGQPIGGDDFASASGSGSTAAAFGDYDIADVSGTDSTATAGFEGDYVSVLGNDLSAVATGNFQFITDPALFGAAAVPVDDFGLSNLLADFSSLGL